MTFQQQQLRTKFREDAYFTYSPHRFHSSHRPFLGPSTHIHFPSCFCMVKLPSSLHPRCISFPPTLLVNKRRRRELMRLGTQIYSPTYTSFFFFCRPPSQKLLSRTSNAVICQPARFSPRVRLKKKKVYSINILAIENRSWFSYFYFPRR